VRASELSDRGSYDHRMNEELAALAAVAAYGSPWLNGGGVGPAPELLGSNSCFQLVRGLHVELGRTGLFRRRKTVQGTAAWLAAMHENEVNGMLLVTQLPTPCDLPPHVSPGFADGGSWGLLAQGSGRSTLWTVGWNVDSATQPTSELWDLTATGHPLNRPQQPPVAPLKAARSTLEWALQLTEQFAARELHDWAPRFVKAQTILDDAEPSPPYHRDLLPSHASLPRRQLAAAAMQAWVFGGIGSWNDVLLPDEAHPGKHGMITRELYDAVLSAITSAVNND
jgi:hypothetical protein